MPTNARTLTIAGETIGPQDLPFGEDWFDPEFVLHAGKINGLFNIIPKYKSAMLICGLMWLYDDAPVCAVRDEHRALMPWIAARCRCWHLDRAEECDVMSFSSVDDYRRKKDAHLASAAKWARIGKGAKG